MASPGSSPPFIVNVADVPEESSYSGQVGGAWKPLTPALAALGGRLGANLSRLPRGYTTCPFHHHLREDEIFFVLSGRGVLRYGEALYDLGPGDCVSCPAGTGVGHQIANPYDDDLVYLAIGPNDPHEVCVYPDSGKVYVRGIGRIGLLADQPYMAGEPDPPRVFELLAARERNRRR
ncbi:MAG: cupin domain-containing protein [Deltaproteobacteria bacterium]|nr:cupin domain-containing protein [Deltaproteobacteria bacterium]